MTFANGVVARELIVGVDKDARRLAYSVVGGQATHHNASFQVVADGARATKLIWITDVLPDSVAATFEAMIDQGAESDAAGAQQATPLAMSPCHQGRRR